MKEIINKILQITQGGASCVAVTVVSSDGSSPRKVGARMLVDQDGRITGTIGGGALEKLVIADALKALKKKKPFLKQYSLDRRAGLQVCGGRVGIFFDVVSPERHLVIAGGGHIGLSLSVIAKLLGFRVTVIDNRRDFASRSRFPHVDQAVCGRYEDAFRRLRLDEKTAIVIVTHGHLHDAAVLGCALRTPAGYIGMIGSRAKIGHVFAQLRKSGVRQGRLAQVHTPIGLDIGAETPEEIAIAIAAELIQVAKNIRDI